MSHSRPVLTYVAPTSSAVDCSRSPNAEMVKQVTTPTVSGRVAACLRWDEVQRKWVNDGVRQVLPDATLQP